VAQLHVRPNWSAGGATACQLHDDDDDDDDTYAQSSCKKYSWLAAAA